MQYDFCAEKCKIGKENLYVTKNWFARNKICCAEDNHSHMNNIHAKGLSDSNFD